MLGSVGLGRLMLKNIALHDLPNIDRGLFYLAFGFATINLTLLFIGLAGQLNVLSVSIVYISVACISLIQISAGVSAVKRYFLQFGELDLKNAWFLLLIPLVILILLNFIGSLAPPSIADALRHHLVASEYYARAGGFEFIPILFWNLPSFLHITYTTEMLLINDIAPSVTHFAFSLISSLAIFALGRRLFDWQVGLLAAVIFYSLPMSIELSVSPMVEMGAVFFVVLGLYALCNSVNTKTLLWITIAGILIGIAGSTKIWAIMTIPAGVTFILVAKPTTYGYFDKKKILGVGLFLVASVAILAPWLIRNFVASGDPLWPMGYSIFNSEMWTEWQHQKFSSWERGPGKSIIDFILGPWNLTNRVNLFSVTHGPLTGSLLTPLIIIFWPAVFLFKAVNNSKISVVILPISFFIFTVYLIWFFGYQSPRYMQIVYPVLALMTAIGIKSILLTNKRWLQIPTTGLLCASLIGSLVIAISFNSIFFSPVFGKESREQFIDRKVSNISSINWVNDNLASDTNTLIMGLSGWYYLQNSWLVGVPSYQGEIQYHKMKHPDQLLYKFRQLGITHILIQGKVGIAPEFLAYANDAYDKRYLIGDLNVLVNGLQNSVSTRKEFEARPFILMAALESEGKLNEIHRGQENVVHSRTFDTKETAEFSVFELTGDN